MKTARVIFKNSVWLIAGEVLGKIAIFFLTIIVAREFGVSNFGKYNLALSFVMIFSVISNLGSNTFLFREIARNKHLSSKYVSNILVMRVILSIIFFIIVYVFAIVFNYSADVKRLVYLFAGWSCFLNLTYVFRSGFKAMEAMKWDAVVSALDNILRLIITAILICMGLNIFGVGVAYLMATFIALCLGIFLWIRNFSKLDFRLDFSLWQVAIREMRFLALVAILAPLFGRIDVLVISHFNGESAVGLYSASLKLVWMLIFLPDFISQAAFPRLSQHALNNIDKFSRLISYLLKANLVLTFFVSLLAFLLAHQIISLIYGVRYLASVKVLQILIWIFPLHGINSVFIHGLNAKNKQKINTILIGLILIINVILAIILAQKYSYIGVAFATLISAFLLSISFIIYYLQNSYLDLRKMLFKLNDFLMIKRIIFKSQEIE